MTANATTLARLESIVERLEALGLAPYPVDPDDDDRAITLPPYVASGELIESSWGNAVVNALIYLSTRNGITAVGSTQIAAGQQQQCSWSSLSTPDWGAGPVLIAPALTDGLYVLSCDVDGPDMGPNEFASVVIGAKATTFANHIVPGRNQVTAFGLIDLAVGDQVSVSVYNPQTAPAFYTCTLSVYRFSA